MIVDDERTSERSDAPTQLNYAQTPKWHRRKLTKRIVIAVIVVALLPFVIRLARSSIYRAQLVYWQNRCLSYRPEQQQPVLKWTDSSKTIKVSGFTPTDWTNFYSLLSPPGSSPSGTAFVSSVRTPAGEERLVAIELFFGTGLTHPPNLTSELLVNVHMIEPGSLLQRPREMKVTVFRDKLFSHRGDLRQGHVEMGYRDASDPSHFVIPYVVSDQRILIDGWITGDNTVVLEDREQKQAKQ